jgi:hypothetical protein
MPARTIILKSLDKRASLKNLIINADLQWKSAGGWAWIIAWIGYLTEIVILKLSDSG